MRLSLFRPLALRWAVALSGAAATACGGGGSSSPEPAAESEAALGSWSTVAASGSPRPRHEAAFVKVNDRLFLLGGRRIQPVDIFDPATKSWSSGAAPPVETHHFQSVVVDNKVWLVGAMTGGFPNETPLDHIPVYDPATNTWSRGPAIPADRRRGSAGAVVVGSKLYMAGGITQGHQSGNVAWLDVLDIPTGQWTVLPDAPRARDHFQAAVVGAKIYLVGGRQTRGATGQVFDLVQTAADVYDIQTNTWSTLQGADSALPQPRAGTMSYALGRYVAVGGGESLQQPTAHAEVHALNTTTGRWVTWPTFVRGRHGTGFARAGDQLYVASGSGNRGGSPELDTIESADIPAALR
jgi:Galactose oxidase, central domain